MRCGFPKLPSCSHTRHGTKISFFHSLNTLGNLSPARLPYKTPFSEKKGDHRFKFLLNPALPPSIHSSYTLCPHPRNVSNQVLDLLAQNGGLLMICFLPSLVAPPPSSSNASPNATDSTPPTATLMDVVDHIIYAGARIGFKHVGIGSDFDGMLHGPQGLDDVSRYPHLVAEMLRRGMSEDDIRMVVGANVISLLERVEEKARRLRDWEEDDKNGPGTKMLCDEIAPVFTDAQHAMLLEQAHHRQTQDHSHVQPLV